jgi:hypothetical protein
VLIPVLLFAAQRPTAAAATVLTIFTGVADVARGNADFALASDGAVLANGDRVRTDDRGHALITFFDGSTLEIEPSTTIQVVTASGNADGSIAIVLGQALGRTWASVHKLTHTDSKFEIQTPTSTASVRGTGFLTEVLANGDTTVQTTDGIVAVTGQGQSVLVTQGLQTTVRRNEVPTTPAAMPTPSTTLRFGMHSPAYLVVIDPLGRSCGITNPGATIVRHIPGCVASAPGSEPQLIDLPDAVPGTYRAVIASIDPGGPFTLSATGIDDRGNVSFDLSLPGDGRPGAVFGSALDVLPGPDGRLSASALAALVTLQGPPSPSDSPSPIPAVFASPNVVPDIALPSLPVATATPTEAATATPTPTPRTPAPEVRTPSPAPAPAATPAPTPTASPTPIASASASPAPTPTTAPASTPESTPASTTAPPTGEPTTPPPATTAPPSATTAPPATTTPPSATTPIPGCTPSVNQPKKCG